MILSLVLATVNLIVASFMLWGFVRNNYNITYYATPYIIGLMGEEWSRRAVRSFRRHQKVFVLLFLLNLTLGAWNLHQWWIGA